MVPAFMARRQVDAQAAVAEAVFASRTPKAGGMDMGAQGHERRIPGAAEQAQPGTKAGAV